MGRKSQVCRGQTTVKTEFDAPSRRKFLFSLLWTTLLANGAALIGASKTAEAQQKLSKEQAKYQGSPKGDQKCSSCTYFIKPSSCKLVEGDISPDGWCQLWTQAS
jgi:hypothetical protein